MCFQSHKYLPPLAYVRRTQTTNGTCTYMGQLINSHVSRVGSVKQTGMCLAVKTCWYIIMCRKGVVVCVCVCVCIAPTTALRLDGAIMPVVV